MDRARGNLSDSRLLRLRLLVLLSLFVLAVGAAAQRRGGLLTVRVSDTRDELPIPHADVRLYVFAEGNFAHQAFADAGGRASFSVSAGSYKVVALAEGYETAAEEVEVGGGEQSTVMLRLRPKEREAAVKPGNTISSAALNVPTEAKREFDAGLSTLESDPSASIPHFEKAIERYPKYSQAYVSMALADLALKEREAAARALTKAIDVDPDSSRAYTLRGRMYLEDGDFSRAVSLLQESLRLNPQAWDAHFELARCYYNTGKIKEALAQALSARDSPQASPATHLLLADIYAKQNLKKETLGELEAFVKADPANPMIPRVQRKIEQLRNNP